MKPEAHLNPPVLPRPRECGWSGQTQQRLSVSLVWSLVCVSVLLAASVPLRGDAAPAAADHASTTNRVLVGVNYFAGWWEDLPNKWHGKGWSASEPDWRMEYPGRVPILGCYNDQPTMDRELAAAAAHGVDFFSILWYYAPAGSPQEAHAPLLNRGVANFLRSTNSSLLKFIIEYCNAPGFAATNAAQWADCIQTWVAAMRHPSYLRVGGRLVFKVHSADQFLKLNQYDPQRCGALLNELRQAARAAGLGELLIGGGIMSRTRVLPAQPITHVFDFTATYMDIPPVEVRDAELPFATLAAEARSARAAHATDPIAWVPYLAAGWNPRPWTHPGADPNHRRFFTFPTRQEWSAELESMRADLRRYPSLGLPLPGGGRQPIFTIYAWNEFGEGGIVAPTQGEGYLKLEAIRQVFPPPAVGGRPN